MSNPSIDTDEVQLYNPLFPADWEPHSLYSLANWVNGMAFRNSEFADAGLPVIKIAEIKNGISEQTKLTNRSYSDYYRVNPGDMLFSWSGQPETSIDTFWWRGPEGWLNQHIFKVTSDSSICSQEFLYYLLKYLKPNFIAVARNKQTTGLGHVAKADLKRFAVRIPSGHEQAAIVGTLKPLDDKIEHIRRTSRALETLARATFKAWFVDFEPVKAKAAGVMSFPGMSASTFAVLPDCLTDSPVGLVPHGWAVQPLSKVATFLNGLALQKYPPAGDGTDLPVVKIAELRRGSADGAGLANASVPEAYIVEDGDLLFSWSGTLEAELWFGGRGAHNQHLFKVTSDAYPRWFCLHWVRQHLPEFRVIASSKATTMGHIKRGHLDDALVVVPDAVSLQAADNVIGTLYDLLASLAVESRKLAAVRDYLLPRLLSGQVRVVPSQQG